MEQVGKSYKKTVISAKTGEPVERRFAVFMCPFGTEEEHEVNRGRQRKKCGSLTCKCNAHVVTSPEQAKAKKRLIVVRKLGNIDGEQHVEFKCPRCGFVFNGPYRRYRNHETCGCAIWGKRFNYYVNLGKPQVGTKCSDCGEEVKDGWVYGSRITGKWRYYCPPCFADPIALRREHPDIAEQYKAGRDKIDKDFLAYLASEEFHILMCRRHQLAPDMHQMHVMGLIFALEEARGVSLLPKLPEGGEELVAAVYERMRTRPGLS